MKELKEYTDTRYIRRLYSRDKFKAIEELASAFSGTSVCKSVDELIAALVDREKIMSTGIGFGIAIPHAKIKGVREIAFAVGISQSGIDFDSMDGKPVHIIILFAAGERQQKDYLTLLSRIMSILKDEAVRAQIINSGSADEIIKIFAGGEKV
jgi:mannitol/fructose-specific phosphotransferase system IIA component (Ntr-type)